ncbi:hypothetical protein [Bacillus sp. ISL-37]|uniref:hypothetical protein n=1 Tax=Bacillus sp. ISL-37 TaxID=2819123 RepID=UPI001BEA1BCB|nr:hypothetical protein [Bacillus sp. ISL-37]MBT2686019.1 hypothetical protein [Bacillus sp. ISL-37]
MIAEIGGKISRRGSNLSERLEDDLTGNVFGALRYIPFSKGLGEVLANSIFPRKLKADFWEIDIDFWANMIEFWPYDREGEVDVLINFPSTMIGVEVKYLSGLSSDDDVVNGGSDQEIQVSINQLARESRILARKGQGKQKLLLFIADRKACKDTYRNIVERGIIEQGVDFGYVSWQDILKELKQLVITDVYQQVIVQDLIDLLTRKGFEDFTSMAVETSIPIDKDEFFKFEVMSHAFISFKTPIKISEGLHYEFSK